MSSRRVLTPGHTYLPTYIETVCTWDVALTTRRDT